MKNRKMKHLKPLLILAVIAASCTKEVTPVESSRIELPPVVDPEWRGVSEWYDYTSIWLQPGDTLIQNTAPIPGVEWGTQTYVGR